MAIKAYEPLANVTLASTAAAVTFSGINQNYSDLVIVSETIIANSQVALVSMQLNGLSSIVYDYSYFTGNGGSVSAVNDSSSYMRLSDLYTNTMSEIQIMGYAATNIDKPILVKTNGGSNIIEMYGGRFSNSNPITSVRIFAQGQSFAAGSTFALYGVV